MDSGTLRIVNGKFGHLENTSLTQVHFLKEKSSEPNVRTNVRQTGGHTSLCRDLSLTTLSFAACLLRVYAESCQ